MKRTIVILSATFALAPAATAQQPSRPTPPPAQVEETITVSATRQPLALDELTATAYLLPGEALRRRPALGLDEALRWTPQFSLLRRSPARAAHPTSQGINLRGIAPSGTSRALVLVDGVPLSDPFGGWINWNRIPDLAIERVELSLGGGSSTFGNEALAGTLQIVVREPGSSASARASGTVGSQSSVRAGGAASFGSANSGLLAAADIFDTGGYLAVEPAARGAVDRPVATEHRSVLLRGRSGGWRLGADYMSESRDNGTVEQTNSTRVGGFTVGYRDRASAARPQVTVFARWQRFRSRFSSVASTRDSELAVLDQEVPSSEIGATAHAWKDAGESTTFGVGADWRRVDGESREQVLLAGFERKPGGTRNSGGLYAAGRWRASSSLHLEGALRGDAWKQSDRSESGMDRDRTTISPRLGVLWSADPRWVLRGSAYRSFRAPTLNELYRQFRVGNVSTRANDELREETLTGWEIGATARPSAALRFGITAYATRLHDGVVNATIGATPTLILRQRRNLGEATIRGLELDAGWSRGALSISVAAAWIRSRIVDDAGIAGAGAAPLTGNRLPQVPTHRVNGTIAWQRGPWGAIAAIHVVGDQFEDDRNRLPLEGGVTADLGVERDLSAELRIALRAQNLGDHRLPVGRTPVLLLGPPRSILLTLDFTPEGSTRD